MRRALLLVVAVLIAAPSAAAAPAHDITIAVSGDLLVHEAVWRQAAAYADGDGYDFRPMLRRVRPLIAGADLAICHVETPLTARTTAPTAFPVFSTPPALAVAIRRAGFDACSTASNHSLDQGPAGITATLRALDASGVHHTGSARSAREARRPLILETAGGVRVALLAFTQVTNGQVPEPAWRVNDIGSDARPILAQARQARRLGADVVVVNLHWGIELQHEPTSEQLALAQALGRSRLVTAVVGQHAHVVQPIRRAGGALVLFGEGNLLSGQAKSAEFRLPAEAQDGLIGLLRIRVPATGRAVLRRIDYAPVYVDHADYVVVPVGADPSKPEYAASLARTTAAIGHGPRFGVWRRMTP